LRNGLNFLEVFTADVLVKKIVAGNAAAYQHCLVVNNNLSLAFSIGDMEANQHTQCTNTTAIFHH
jgi:hypothetical protein